MDAKERFELIKLPPTEEIITEKELIELLEENTRIVAYDGFEPSGKMHLGSCVLRAIKLNDFLKANIDFILYIADWFAFLNKKFNGDLELIRKAGKYFVEGWKAAGVDVEKIKIVWASELTKDPEYWETVMKISNLVTIKRVLRAVAIAGREESEVKNPSLILYPLMQATDVFMLNGKKGVDICQLGMDQRKVNMLAREIAPMLNRKKPIAIHHHLLAGLVGKERMGKFDENEEINRQINVKMSKSKPETAIFIHDSEEEIKQKINKAYCPLEEENNPILEIAKYIIFRKFESFEVKRKKEYGGNLEFQNYEELRNAYLSKKLHPLDLKNAVAEYVNIIIEPIREHFEKNEKIREEYLQIIKG
jgi:tyrosyl-tRNA synthetase